MKAKTSTEKKHARPAGGFDAVKMMREIRDKIDKQTEGMTFEELKQYYKQSAEENRKRAGR